MINKIKLIYIDWCLIGHICFCKDRISLFQVILLTSAPYLYWQHEDPTRIEVVLDLSIFLRRRIHSGWDFLTRLVILSNKYFYAWCQWKLFFTVALLHFWQRLFKCLLGLCNFWQEIWRYCPYSIDISSHHIFLNISSKLKKGFSLPNVRFWWDGMRIFESK